MSILNQLNETAILTELKAKPVLLDRQKSRIKASNDAEAVECFLDEYRHKEATFRSYKKEVRRFLVWCVKERKTSFSQLNRDDVDAYIEFIKNPQPAHIWC